MPPGSDRAGDPDVPRLADCLAELADLLARTPPGNPPAVALADQIGARVRTVRTQLGCGRCAGGGAGRCQCEERCPAPGCPAPGWPRRG